MIHNQFDKQLKKMRSVLRSNGVAPDVIEKITIEMEKKRKDEPAPKIAIIGECGAGKTSTINALFNAGLPISHVEPCTKCAFEKQFITSSGKPITIVDLPGIGESISADSRIIEIYKKVYPTVDVLLWIVPAGNRQLTIMQHMLLQIKQITGRVGINRLVFAINKADIMYPVNWNNRINMPSDEQNQYLINFSETVRNRIREVIPNWKGNIPIYSAIKAYNLNELLLTMLEAAPKTRGYILSENSNLDDFMKYVDPNIRDTAYMLLSENENGVEFDE